MNLFKKSFALFSFLFLFIFGLNFISAHKAEATLTVRVTANGSPNITVNSGSNVTIKWDATGADNITCTPPSGYSSAGNLSSGNFTINNVTAKTTITIDCKSPAIQGSLCPAGSNISEALTVHKLQDNGIWYIPSGGYPHHSYQTWVTSSSNLSNGATIKVSRTEFVYPNFAGSSLVQENSCDTYSIPPGTNTSGSLDNLLNVDSGPTSILSIASSSYSATKTPLASYEFSRLSVNTTYTTGNYYGMPQNFYTSVVKTNSSYGYDVYVRLVGSSQMYPYSGSSLVTIPIDVTLKIPANSTTSTTEQFYGVSQSLSINSAWYY